MKFDSRKFNIWLISLIAIIAVFLFYRQIGEIPDVEFDQPSSIREIIADGNAADIDGKFGKVGQGTEIGTVKYATYKSDNREFGFKELIQKTGSEWEIEKPYMNIFQRDFTCYITADLGQVQVEQGLGSQINPKDATLKGNVEVHIIPKSNSDITECFIYFDDLDFISESSKISTNGPIEFVSSDARLIGNGMELVYNELLGRLESLRIVQLESLHLKTRSPDPSALPKETEPPQNQDNQRTQYRPDPNRIPIKRDDGEYYRCVLSSNVKIDCPGQIVLADDIFINNIFFSKGSDKKAETADADDTQTPKQDNTDAETLNTDPPENDTIIPPNELVAYNITEENEPNINQEQVQDIIVTCENGILIIPMETSIEHFNITSTTIAPKNIDDANNRTTITAQRIDYGAALGTITLAGDARCVMFEQEKDLQLKHRLSAPRLFVTLNQGQNKRNPDVNTQMKHLTADGGIVQIDTSKWSSEKMLGFTKIKCLQFDFDTEMNKFWATGPDGLIAVDNTKITEPDRELGKLDLQQQCTAVIQGFDTLEYHLDKNKIIADANSRLIEILYVPYEKGQYGSSTSAVTKHIEVDLVETQSGRIELLSVTATGGISYTEEKVQFEGSGFYYDAETDMIKAWGDDSQPAYLNGALVKGVEYNLKTGKAKSRVVSPSMFIVK